MHPSQRGEPIYKRLFRWKRLAVACAVLVGFASPLGQQPPVPSSCKPSVPLWVAADSAAPEAAGRWTLQLGSLDADREVVVWMWSTGGDRRAVWHGRLRREEATRVDVAFEPAAGADEVFVALEPVASEGFEMRRVAAVPVPGRGRSAKPAAELVTVPGSGRRILLFTGDAGETR